LSVALIKMILAEEEAELKNLKKKEEEATNILLKQILDEERNKREEELKQKIYNCLICFTDLKKLKKCIH